MSTPIETAVPGLLVCTEFFSHSIEEALYHNAHLFPFAEAQVTTPRMGTPHGAFMDASFPIEAIKVCNGIVKSGLFPEFLAPNYCLPLSYPDKGSFKAHFDSRYRWGETIAAITLGWGGVMSFLPTEKSIKQGPPPPNGNYSDPSGLRTVVRFTGKEKKNWVIDVYLPPRSIYIMSGSSRYDYKHCVLQNSEQRREIGAINPSLRAYPVRRTITMRCTKCFGDEVLKRAINMSPPSDVYRRLQERIRQQSKFRPQNDYGQGRANNDEIAMMRAQASQQVSLVHMSFQKVFLAPHERGYQVQNKGACCWPLLKGRGQSPISATAAAAAIGAAMAATSAGGGSGSWGSGQAIKTNAHVATNSSVTASSPQVILSKVELRAKRLAALGVEKVSTTTNGVAGRRVSEDAVDLLSSSDDDDDDDEDVKMPATKKAKVEPSKNEVIEIEDEDSDDSED